MDPNELLAELRRMVLEMQQSRDEDDEGSMADIGASFADKFTDLDNWITNGGFLPHDWMDRTPPDGP